MCAKNFPPFNSTANTSDAPFTADKLCSIEVQRNSTKCYISRWNDIDVPTNQMVEPSLWQAQELWLDSFSPSHRADEGG